ncbi:MAG: primosomal protein N' [Firmicutes bacterium]|nr:primosomal protein N' [Bacillota bacterium]
MKYVKVVIDQVSDHVDALYTYKCSDNSVCVGSRVFVPFGKGNRKKAAYVFQVSEENEENIKNIKTVFEIDDSYTLPEDLVRLCVWMKKEYLCRYIDGIKCVIPPGEAAKRGRRKDPYAYMEVAPETSPELTEEQKKALSEILPSVVNRKPDVFLLHGVTSSGKTEVYMQVADKVLKEGRSVIVLVPEISLTPQTIMRFMSRFGGENIAVLHSKLTKGQRFDQWMRVRNGGAKILIGARSGIFAPFENLGAVIIDEEHEASYKSDMTPKYDTIDAAIERGKISKAIVVLGTATPSVVTAYRAKQGFYHEITLKKRYNKTPLPMVNIVDMREELKKGNRSIFSIMLHNKIEENLKTGRQIILFLNRRGYSSFVSCRACGYVMKCDDCGVSLTFHKYSGMAECHYCGRKIKVPELCPSCGGRYIKHFGIGTEKVEEMAKEAFPQASVSRLDMDTVRRKGEAEKIINAFRRKKTDIMVGTQLVAKGLDFANVGLVGIMAADITLNIPDYRSSERTFQLIVQAAGRSGRGEQPGEVVIQTYSPENRAIFTAAKNDYEGFYKNEIALRSLTGYPPFTNIIRLVFLGENEDNVKTEASEVYERIKESDLFVKGEVLRPQPTYMAKLNDNYRYHLIIKSPVEKTSGYIKLISEIKNERTASARIKTNMLTEIDPYSFT